MIDATYAANKGNHYAASGYNLNQALGVYTGFYGAPRQYSLTARYQF